MEGGGGGGGKPNDWDEYRMEGGGGGGAGSERWGCSGKEWVRESEVGASMFICHTISSCSSSAKLLVRPFFLVFLAKRLYKRREIKKTKKE